MSEEENNKNPSNPDESDDSGIYNIVVEAKKRGAVMIANGAKYIKVARAIGIDEHTLRTWRKTDTEFQKLIRQEQEISLFEIRDMYTGLRMDAIDTLKDQLENARDLARDATRDGTRLSAIRLASDLAFKILGSADLELKEATLKEAIPDFTEEQLQHIRENVYGILPTDMEQEATA